MWEKWINWPQYWRKNGTDLILVNSGVTTLKDKDGNVLAGGDWSSSITETYFPKKGSTWFEDSAILETALEVQCAKNFYAPEIRTDSSSIFLGSIILSSNTKSLEIQNRVTNNRRIALQIRYDDTGSCCPYAPILGTKVDVNIQTLEDETLSATNSFTYDVSADRHTSALKIKPAEAGNFSAIVYDTDASGEELFRVTDFIIEAGDVGTVVEITQSDGGQAIVEAWTTIYIEMSGVALKGHTYTSDPTYWTQAFPYLVLSAQPYSEKDLAKVEDNYFGKEFEVFQSLAESSSTSVWTNKIDATTAEKPIGTYRIGFQCEITETGASEEVRFLVDWVAIHDHTTGNDELEPNLETYNWTPLSGLHYITLTSASTIDINIQHKDSGYWKISNATIEIWRVS